jgi:hypothetical protein
LNLSCHFLAPLPKLGFALDSTFDAVANFKRMMSESDCSQMSYPKLELNLE